MIEYSLKRCYIMITHQHDKWNNSGTENVFKKKKDYLDCCKQKWSSLLNVS